MADLYTKNWKLKNIETVLFDKDGTFADSNIYWGRIIEMRAEAVMKNYQISPESYYDLCFALGYDLNTKKLTPKGPVGLLSRDGVIDKFLSFLNQIGVSSDFDTISNIFDDVHKEFYKNMYDYIKIIDGAEALFKRLKEKNVRMAVVTSDVHQNTTAILEHLGLSKYFSLVIGKDDCTKPKKTGEPALIAIEKLGADPKKTISAGDAQMDYLMAENAGLKGSILVATGQTPIEELSEYTNCVTNNLSEVLVN